MALVSVLCLPVIRPMQAQDLLRGGWEGSWTRAGAPLAVTFEFQRTDSGYTGLFGSIPLRVTGIPLSKIVYRAPNLHYEIVGDRTTIVFDGKLERNSISGSFKDGDALGTFVLRRAAGRVKPAYHEEDVSFQNGDVTLSGSILLPNDGKKQHPALLFLHGSGPEGRYASRFLADVFARKGIATLIYDKRGVGSSTGSWRTSDFNALAQDAIAGVENLRKRRDIDPRRIGIYGHSQGAAIAPLVASRVRVAFVIASAASAIPAAEGERYSLWNSLGATDLTPAEAAEARRFVDLVVESGRQGGRSAELDSAVAHDSTARWSFEVPARDSYYWAFSKAIASFDPSLYWRQVHVPALFLYGARDRRVSVTESIGHIRSALNAANNRRYTIKVFPNADHTLRVVAANGTAFHWPENPTGYMETLVDWTLRIVREIK